MGLEALHIFTPLSHETTSPSGHLALKPSTVGRPFGHDAIRPLGPQTHSPFGPQTPNLMEAIIPFRAQLAAISQRGDRSPNRRARRHFGFQAALGPYTVGLRPSGGRFALTP